MRLNDSVYSQTIAKYQDSVERATRNAYVETIRFLASLSPLMELDEAKIVAFDAKVNRMESWPSRLLDNNTDITTVKGLLKYKGVQLDIAIVRNGDLYLKFPTVDLEVLEIYSREKRQWKRSIDMPKYYTPEAPDSVELKAFMEHRLPTFEEIKSMYGTVKSNNKTNYNSLWLSLSSTDPIDKIEDAHRRYMSATRRVNVSKEHSKDLVVKQYTKLRGIPAYDRWRLTQNPVPPPITNDNKKTDKLSTK